MAIARRIQTTVTLEGVTYESNILVRSMEERPDWQAPDMDAPVFVLRDLWPSVNGQGDSWPQWARDSYLIDWNDPCMNRGAGGETHLFAMANGSGEQCGVIHDKTFFGWTDGFDKLGDPTYTSFVPMKAVEVHGWVNWFVSNGYYPDQGQRGPWCWCPVGVADVVDGGGLPFRRHVSWFAVWERMTYRDYLLERDGVVVPPTGDLTEVLARLEALQAGQDAISGRLDRIFK
ncbi:MAG: hypothetical protein KDI56_09585 [Xanthomonadales bacterium]|nr:hypothetical protein [Caldilinea sp.]MCB1589141.1 hypothetical protein [Xanthomonadales bacterium]